ncbi:MAG: LysR family transcriptional regulator [Clostridia bacterium]|nr:LysR family transcriptional regulator [Clostridia bacterium]
MDINFELYKIFYLAAKAESFTGAAEKLFISQSAVSQAVKNLEDKLGSQLFFRNSRSIKLTGEGELLFKHIEQAYNLIKTAETKLTEIQNLTFGEIRIGASDTVCKYHLIPCIENFSQEHQGIKIHLVNRTSSQILNTLKKGLIDFGIVTLPAEDKSIDVVEWLKVEDIFVASEKFNPLKNQKISMQDISRHPLLMLQKNSSTRQFFDSYLSEKGIEILPEMELESVDLLVEFAKIGLGIAHVYKDSALEAIRKQELFEIQVTEKLPTRTLGIVSLKNVPPSRASKEFIKYLKDLQP